MQISGGNHLKNRTDNTGYKIKYAQMYFTSNSTYNLLHKVTLFLKKSGGIVAKAMSWLLYSPIVSISLDV